MINRLARVILIALSFSWIVCLSHSALAHDYDELEPLNSDLRSFLIRVLEDAAAQDRLDGDPEKVNAAPNRVSMRLMAVIDSVVDEDLRWLESADYSELTHPVYGRVPAGVILQQFSTLAGEVAHAEEHQEAKGTTDPQFKLDMDRLKRLSDQTWGR